MALIFLPLVAVLCFVMIVPQQRRVRAQQALVASLQVGDEVVTTAGMIGTITAVDDVVATLRIADGVEVRMARGAIGRRAADLLAHSTLAVRDVALACGFASMSSFARAFREEHGHPPKLARRH